MVLCVNWLKSGACVGNLVPLYVAMIQNISTYVSLNGIIVSDFKPSILSFGSLSGNKFLKPLLHNHNAK